MKNLTIKTGIPLLGLSLFLVSCNSGSNSSNGPSTGNNASGVKSLQAGNQTASIPFCSGTGQNEKKYPDVCGLCSITENPSSTINDVQDFVQAHPGVLGNQYYNVDNPIFGQGLTRIPLLCSIHADREDEFLKLYELYSKPDVNANVGMNSTYSLFSLSLAYGDWHFIQTLVKLGGLAIRTVYSSNSGGSYTYIVDEILAAAPTNTPDVMHHLLTEWMPSWNADTRHVPSDMQGALLAAANDNSNFEVIQELMKAGALINGPGSDGETALMAASLNNPNPNVVQALITAGAKVNAIDNSGNDALLYYTRAGSVIVGNGLYIHQPVVPHQGDLTNRMKIPAILLAAGAQVNATNTDGDAPLYAAAESKLPAEVISEFLKAGASVNYSTNSSASASPTTYGWTALYAASCLDSVDVVQQLIGAGANVNVQMNEQDEGLIRTPLGCAASNNSIPVMKALIAGGAQVNLPGGSDLFFALPESLRMGANDPNSSIARMQVLLSAGAPVDGGDENGITALMYAAQGGYDNAETPTTDAIRFLIGQHANIFSADKNGENALEYAAMAATTDPTGNRSPRMQHPFANLQLLISEGGGVNTLDKNGLTLLLFLAKEEASTKALVDSDDNLIPEVVNILVKSGADVNAKTPEGKTALDLLLASPDSQSRNCNGIQTLIAAGAKSLLPLPNSKCSAS